MFDKFQPKFSKRYAEVGLTIASAIEHYTNEVANRTFPTMAHSYKMAAGVPEAFVAAASSVDGALPVDTAKIQTFLAASSASKSTATTNKASGAPSVPSLPAGSTSRVPSPCTSPQPGPTGTGTVASAAAAAVVNSSTSSPVSRVIAPSVDQVVVIGGGAMGSLVASRLSLVGGTMRVALLSSWTEHISAIRDHGIKLMQAPGESPLMHTSRTLLASSHVDQVLASQRADKPTVVIVLGKGAEQTLKAATAALPILERNPYNMVVTLQNGIGYAELLERTLGAERVVSGFTCEGARLLAPGHVLHTGNGPTVLLPRTQLQEAVMERLLALLGASGFNGSLVPHSQPSVQQAAVWSKLLVNCAINPVTAIMRVTNGELLTSPSAEALMRSILDEAMRVARAKGVEIPFASSDEALERVRHVAHSTATNRSSMYSDVLRGVPSEIDFINGHVVRAGHECGIATPTNSTLVTLIQALEGCSNKQAHCDASSVATRVATTAASHHQQQHQHQQSLAQPAEPVAMRSLFASVVAPSVVALPKQQRISAAHYSTAVASISSQQPSSAPSSNSGSTQQRATVPVLTSVSALRHMRHQWRMKNERVGFVPTMGALHQGHLDLVRQAKRTCDRVVVSIFVNPTQFAPHEDLERYPRTLERDLALLAAEIDGGVDCVFAPTVVEMYGNVLPGGRTDANTMVVLENIEGRCHESLSRPGFFKGVATVVSKLFNMLQPDRAFFGQKDAIQCIVIKQLVRDLNFPIEVEIVDTTREPDGLAMSSRNQYLSSAERAAAPVVYRSLVAAANLTGTEQLASRMRSAVLKVLRQEPLVHTVDYVSIADASTGIEVPDDTSVPAGTQLLLSIAVRIGATRLIDNVLVTART